MESVLEASTPGLTYVPWINRKMCPAMAQWPDGYRSPPPLGALSDAAWLRELCTHYIRVLKISVYPRPQTPLHTMLNSRVTHRPLVHRLALQCMLEDIRPQP